MKQARIHLEIVEDLREVRRRQRLRRDVLAEIMGYHWQTVGRWERGESTPSCQALHDWCEALGLKLRVEQR